LLLQLGHVRCLQRAGIAAVGINEIGDPDLAILPRSFARPVFLPLRSTKEKSGTEP
jgi:hypothetical protein